MSFHSYYCLLLHFRRVLLSSDTDGIFYWLFWGHKWWSVQAQLLYNFTDASALFLSLGIFFLFFKTYSYITIIIIIIIIIIISSLLLLATPTT